MLEVLGNYGVLPKREVDTTPFNADTSRKPVMGRVARYVSSWFFHFGTTDLTGQGLLHSLSCCFARRDLEILQWLNTHRQEAAQWTTWHNSRTTESCKDNHISGTPKRRLAGSCESLLFTKRRSMRRSRNKRQHPVAFPNPSPKLNPKINQQPLEKHTHTPSKSLKNLLYEVTKYIYHQALRFYQAPPSFTRWPHGSCWTRRPCCSTRARLRGWKATCARCRAASVPPILRQRRRCWERQCPRPWMG